MKQLVRVIGDRDNPFHRQSLAGNAMLFTNQIWVRLTAGVHSIYTQIENLEATVVASFFGTNFHGEGSVILSQSLGFRPTTNGGELANGFGFMVYNLGILHSNKNFANRYTNQTVNLQLQRRRHIAITKIPGLALPTIVNSCGKMNAGRLTFDPGPSMSSGTPNLTDFDPRNFIDIGCASGLTSRTNFFYGYIRSVEYLPKILTNEELRAAFNYGTIYHAWQAGKISISNPTDLISIDFNRLNGQPPICRTGTRQLTVQVYNNTTPDNTVATYTDWYSL